MPAIHALGAKWWPLAMARELDDAILMLRTNDLHNRYVGHQDPRRC